MAATLGQRDADQPVVLTCSDRRSLELVLDALARTGISLTIRIEAPTETPEAEPAGRRSQSPVATDWPYHVPVEDLGIP